MDSGNGVDTTWTARLGKHRQVLGLAFAMVCAAGMIVAVTDPIAQAGDTATVTQRGGGKIFRAALECSDGVPSRLADVRAASPADARQSLADVYPGCKVGRVDKRSFSDRYF